LASAGKVVLLVSGFVLTVTGAAVYSFFLQRWRVSWPFRLLGFIILAIYLPLTLAMLAATGIIDCVWNIRRLNPDGRGPEEDDKK
jgi:uncharacterized protein YybS (DUF2232 family)